MATPSSAQAAAQAALKAQQMNAAIRNGILGSALRLRQPIYNQAWTPASQPQLTFRPNFIGLLRSFTVVITGTVNNTDGALDATLSDLGTAAILDPNQGIVLQDLNGYNRIQTGLWHLLAVESVKRHRLYAAQNNFNAGSTPWENAGQWTPISQPGATIAHGASSPFRIQFDIPITYNPDDLRGAIWISVVNATMQCTLTINPALFVAAGADTTFAMYGGTTSMNLSGVNVQVYQNYFDQLPSGADGQPALPLQDMSTVYELKKIQFPNIANAVENAFPFTNLRRFLSSTAVYDSSPTTAPPNRFAGSDVNYWALQSASQLYIWRLDPQQFSEMYRHFTGWDLPNGFYYFDHRRQPIYTPASGNMQLLLNPSSAGAGAMVHMAYEDFGDINLLTQATSLPTGY